MRVEKWVIDNIRYGDLVEPLVPIENGSHETALARARTTAGISRVLVKRIPAYEWFARCYATCWPKP